MMSIAGITVAAVLLSTVAMALVVSIAEVNRQMSIAATDSLFDLVAVIFFTVLNVIAAGAGSVYAGAKIGLYASAAISVVYLLLWLLIRERVAPALWRLALAAVLAEAAAVGAGVGARDLDASYLLGFSIGAALFGMVAALLLSQPHESTLRKAAISSAPDVSANIRTSRVATVTNAVLVAMVLLGAGIIWLFVLSPILRLRGTEESPPTATMTPLASATVIRHSEKYAGSVTGYDRGFGSNHCAYFQHTGPYCNGYCSGYRNCISHSFAYAESARCLSLPEAAPSSTAPIVYFM
jgi:hypothetical protein